jgi:hypothetical protein
VALNLALEITLATELRVDTVVYGRFAVKADTRVLEYGRLSEGPAVKASFSIPNSRFSIFLPVVVD